MNIISNNCLGGYIYKNLLHTEYKNPFIWTLFSNPDDYIYMLENFSHINFNRIMIGKDGSGFNNNFYLIIDDHIKLSYIHVFFDANRNSIDTFEHTPGKRGNNIYVQKPWEYIVEKYRERLDRMYAENQTRCFMFEPNLPCNRLHDLPYICKQSHLKCMLFTDLAIQPNEWLSVFPANGLDLPSKICQAYANKIMEFCK